MFWTSVLPVTIFVLANTLCVSESAATGGRQRLNANTLEGGSRIVKRIGSSSLILQPEFPRMTSSSSSSSLPEWSHSSGDTQPNKNDIVQVEEGDDDDIEDDGDDNDVWEEGPLSLPLTGGGSRFRLDEPNDLVVAQLSPEFFRDRMIFSSLPEMQEIPRSQSETVGNRFHYNPLGVGVGGVGERVKPLPLYKKSQSVVASQQPKQQVTWSLAKSNYPVPAEGFIRANGFDKRSPRCIAKCMQQGMVHPLQCHSLC